MSPFGARIRQTNRHGWRRWATAALLAALSMPTQAQPAIGRLEVTLAEQRRLVAADPGNSSLWNDLGSLLLLADERADAEVAYQTAVAVGAQNSSAHYNLALVLLHRGDQTAALRHLESVLEIAPLHARAHYKIGAIHEAEGHKEAAITSYAIAFQLDPELVFPSTNPDVIQNGLVLQALLRREKSGLQAPNLPTLYDDAGRIIQLLVP